jgi:EAL domain-containing protein (putative c-di-GMP-specific phosphodiesterase class I)
VDKYKIPHDLIEVELTETTSEVEFGELKRMTTALRNLGFHISIDDFGIGYSSLNLIKDIPWNVLKIDKSFLPDTCEGCEMSSSNIMFSLVVSMARQLGLECICEGVETQAHIELLKRYGCDLAQGYFFDKPIPVEEFEGRLEKGKYDI